MCYSISVNYYKYNAIVLFTIVLDSVRQRRPSIWS